MIKHASTWMLGVLLGVAAACALDDELENADCESNADCWTNQTCVKTSMQMTEDLAGLCRADGKCLPGEQLGCACAQDSAGVRSCSGPDFNLVKSSDDASCICMGPDDTTG